MTKSLQDASTGSDAKKLAPIYAPRSAWLIFILTFLTFSLSAPFWLVARVREIDRLSVRNFTPWLWFFVPIVVPAQLVALPRLFKATNALDKETKTRRQSIWYVVIFILFVGATLYSSIGEIFALPDWAYVVILFLFSVAVAIWEYRLNLTKGHLAGIEFVEIKFVYKIWEWLLLAIGAPLTLGLFYFLVLAPFLAEVEKTPMNTTIAEPNRPYEVTILSEGWSKVKMGTHSEGSAELELSGPLLHMYYVIFSHGYENDLNSVSYWRQEQMINDTPKTICKHTRAFDKTSLTVNALVICEGKSLGDPMVELSKTIHTDKGIYEIYGRFSDSHRSFFRHKASFVNIGKGFKSK